MKATVVLLADNETANFGRKLMLEANKIGQVGYEMARLPFHISLKQPFSIASLEDMEDFFDNYAKSVSPVEVQFEELELCPNNIIGGKPSGCLSLRVKKTEQLDQMQKLLFSTLEERFGPCPALHDEYYVFHMTVAIGHQSLEQYEKAYEILKVQDISRVGKFHNLGLLYYDDDNIAPGTYFCYKTVELI